MDTSHSTTLTCSEIFIFGRGNINRTNSYEKEFTNVLQHQISRHLIDLTSITSKIHEISVTNISENDLNNMKENEISDTVYQLVN